MTVELFQGSLVYQVSLGDIPALGIVGACIVAAMPMSLHSLFYNCVGSSLNDGMWHTVNIIRNATIRLIYSILHLYGSHSYHSLV